MSDAATVNVPTKRVAKACDNCRAKKIKCNGVEPCVNCEKSSLQCAYTYVIKKRQAAPTRVSNRKLLSDLSARLARLEQLLSEVAPKLQEHEGALSVRDEAEEDVKSSQSAGEYSEESEPEDIGLGGSPEDNRKELCMLMCGEGISPFVDDSVGSMGSTSANGLVLEDGIVDEKIDDYCAVHTSATLFSRKGLSFLHKSLGGNDEHVLPLVRLHNVVKRNVALFTKKFFSITAMDDLPPWPDVEDRKELYKQFAGNFLLAYPVLQSDEVQLLGMKLCVPYLEELNVTEQLLASAICLLGASVKGYVDPYSVEKWQEISNNMLVRTLNILQTTWMTTVPDPLNYIQGIILLCLYIENSTIPRSTYVQIAFAIRLGQSLGIHRRETYSSFKDPVERSRRLNVWWWCYRYDRMLSVCAGKPSLIHEHDNTAFDDWNVYQVLRWRLYRDPSYQAEKPTDLDLPKKLTELLLYASSNSLTDLDFALNYYLQKLYNIQGDAYNKLFCNKSMMEKNIRKRISNVRRILKRLDRWEASLPEILRSNKNHDSEQISLLQEKLSNMRKEGEDKMLSTAILSRILLLYIKYSLTRSNVSCAALPLPSPFPSSSAPLKDIPKMFSSFSYSVEHSLYVLKLVDCILQRDCNSHLSIDPLFAYMWAFLSVIGSMFTFDNFSRDTIILLEKYAQTVIGIAKQRKGLFACKWTSVALVAMHFLRVVIDNFNEKCASPCPLSTSTELPIDPQPYISAFDSLQKFLGATCESFATEDNDPPLSGCVGTNSNSASQQCNNLFEPNLPGSNKWSSRTTPSTSYLDNSQSNQPNNAFFQQCPGYNSNTDRSTSDRANLSECPPIANDDDMPLYENDPNAIVEQVLSNLELDINFDGVSANGYLLKMPYYLS